MGSGSHPGTLSGADDGLSATKRGPATGLAAAYARFVRTVTFIYLGTPAVALALFVTALVTDLAHEKETARQTLSLETQVRAHYLSRHLQLLADELTRLGLRSEVDLLDQNMEPERSLLRLTHEKSAFFNVGVAILSTEGSVLWSEPQSFLPKEPAAIGRVLDAVKRTQGIKIAPGGAEPGKPSVLYVASPILRAGRFTGALLGAIDLGSGGAIEQHARTGPRTSLALVTRDGTLIYPPGPTLFSGAPAWTSLPAAEPYVREVTLAGVQTVVAGTPVLGTELTLLSLGQSEALFGPARARLGARLGLGLALASLPLVILVVLLRNSLRTFRKAEEQAVRGDRLRALGEAVDLIAHEVKNALNGIRVGVDLILRGDQTGLSKRQEKALTGIHHEIERLTDFATELLSFSKGLSPRTVSLDLCGFVRKVAELSEATARSRGILLDVAVPFDGVRVKVDPALVHVAIANLMSNALDFAVAGGAEAPSVAVEVDTHRGRGRVRVIDNGPGVSASVRPRLFDPFVTGRPSGVGIGLAISRNIARAHGGDLVLADTRHGAAFHLTLPLEVT